MRHRRTRRIPCLGRPTREDHIGHQQTLTFGQRRELVDQYDVDASTPVLIAVYNGQWDFWDKMPATAADVHAGTGAPAALVMAYDEPEKALG